ncbi:Hypothetical predicted protein [Paramuricea clavata]|uniref:Uncharacterized protein n=1 Tax=Paramuricea clavata TaxID=317549 RepID=A0A6S7HC35_PARCT|nr:Hypothetical predicted protein [Paramuricea clavata]
MTADDTNISTHGSSAAEIQEQLNHDLDNIHQWLLANKLTLNKEKTEYMVIGSRQRLSKVLNEPEIHVGETTIKRDKSCRSANFRKTSTFGEQENCELLKTVDSEEPPGSLKSDGNFDYYKLLQPERKPEDLVSSSIPPRIEQKISTTNSAISKTTDGPTTQPISKLTTKKESALTRKATPTALTTEQTDLTFSSSNVDELRMSTTCTALRKNARRKNLTLPSGTYNMTHDNTSFPVYCDMSSKNATGVTVIGHDSESKIEVNGYEDEQSYRRKINYDIEMKQIVAIINRSARCEQYVKYECLNAGFYYKISGLSYSCWISRQGSEMFNWGGAPTNSFMCACGMNNTCRNPEKYCNCDVNDNVLIEDSGFLTDKKFLPVTELRFGDTGTFVGNNEVGYHTLGKLLCWVLTFAFQ